MSSSTNEVLLVRALAIAVVPDGPMLLLVMCNTLRVLVFVIPSDSNSAPWSPSLLLCMFNSVLQTDHHIHCEVISPHV